MFIAKRSLLEKLWDVGTSRLWYIFLVLKSQKN